MGATPPAKRMWKFKVVEHYSSGTMECACCGVHYLEFLTIDHINGGGNRQRKKLFRHGGGGSKFYRWLISNCFPKGFRVLCNNCNNSLGNFGYCPHTEGQHKFMEAVIHGKTQV